MGKRILLLEKERNLAHFLSLELQKEQYRVDQVEEGQKALSMALQTDYDLILLNAQLGDMTAQDFADKLSRTKPASVIMVLDHREELQDQIETIQRFAVSYIYKPVIIENLVARISAIFRGRDFIDQHCSQMKVPTSYRNLRMDVEHHTVYRGEEMIALTRREYDLLATLMGSKKVLTREQLLESVWKYESATETNIVDVYIRYLRSKLDVKGQKSYIKTVRGVGYTMQEQKSSCSFVTAFLRGFLYIDMQFGLCYNQLWRIRLMKIIKKLMQIVLAVFFFGLLATSAVLADDADSEGWQFVQENGRTYYKKGDIKETDWRVIDGKTYYFDYNGEMVVGWQYIPMPVKGYTIGPYPNGIRLEGSPMPEWYYFDKNGVLQEFVGWKALEVKTKDSVGRKYGEKRTNPEDKEEKSFYTNYYFNQNHSLETGWLYDQSNWYYLAKTEINGENYIGGERRAGWINDGSAWYYLDPETGIMQTGWKQIGNKWYYLRSSGAMATGWYQEDSTWYYLDSENGDMKTGWQYLGNKWYYLRSSGAMATGWVKDGSTWYYLNASNGDMKTGWAKVNGNWYYLNSNGAMVTGSQTIDGKVYNFASSGEWI